jgi:hypothetical protein
LIPKLYNGGYGMPLTIAVGKYWRICWLTTTTGHLFNSNPWQSQQWIVSQINHADRQIITGTPVGMYFPQFFSTEGRTFNGGSGCAKGTN